MKRFSGNGLVAEIVKYGITGFSGLVANLLLLSLFVETEVFSKSIAALVSMSLVLLGSFVLTDRWVFTEPIGSHSTVGPAHRGSAYYAVMLGGKGLNYALYLLLLEGNVWYPVAWVVGSVIAFFGTFSVNRILWHRVFRADSKTAK